MWVGPEMGQKRRFKEHCLNDRFMIDKQPLREISMKVSYWPIPAAAPERQESVESGCGAVAVGST